MKLMQKQITNDEKEIYLKLCGWRYLDIVIMDKFEWWDFKFPHSLTPSKLDGKTLDEAYDIEINK